MGVPTSRAREPYNFGSALQRPDCKLPSVHVHGNAQFKCKCLVRKLNIRRQLRAPKRMVSQHYIPEPLSGIVGVPSVCILESVEPKSPKNPRLPARKNLQSQINRRRQLVYLNLKTNYGLLRDLATEDLQNNSSDMRCISLVRATWTSKYRQHPPRACTWRFMARETGVTYGTTAGMIMLGALMFLFEL